MTEKVKVISPKYRGNYSIVWTKDVSAFCAQIPASPGGNVHEYERVNSLFSLLDRNHGE